MPLAALASEAPNLQAARFCPLPTASRRPEAQPRGWQTTQKHTPSVAVTQLGSILFEKKADFTFKHSNNPSLGLATGHYAARRGNFL